MKNFGITYNVLLFILAYTPRAEQKWAGLDFQSTTCISSEKVLPADDNPFLLFVSSQL